MNHDTLWPDVVGDPTLLGWGVTAAYVVAAWACWRAAGRVGAPPRLAAWWTGIALVMLVLGVNKELDLQAWLAVLGKSMAAQQGWYAHRRAVQALFVALCALAVAGLLGWALYRARALLVRLVWPFAGLGLIGAYALLHVISVHLWRGQQGGGAPTWLIELAGIALVGIGAWRTAPARA